MLRNTNPAIQSNRLPDTACRRTRATPPLPSVTAGPAERTNWRLHRHSKPSQEDTSFDTDRMPPRNHCISAQDVDDRPTLVPGSSPATPLPLHFHETSSDQDSEEGSRHHPQPNSTPSIPSTEPTSTVRMSQFSKAQMESATRRRCMRKCMASSQAALPSESSDRPGVLSSTTVMSRPCTTRSSWTMDRSISRSTVASELARKPAAHSERGTAKSMTKTSSSSSPTKPTSASPSKITSASPSKSTSSPSKTVSSSPSRTSRTSTSTLTRGRETKGLTNPERQLKETTNSAGNSGNNVGRQSARTEKMDNIRPSAPSTTSAAGSRPCLLPAVTLSPASTPPSDVTANSLECWPGQSPNGIYTDVVSPTPIRSANLEQSRSPLQLNNTGARRQHSPPLSPPLSPISPVSAAIPPIEAVQVIVKEDKETQPDILTPNLTEVSLQPHLARRESIQSECCGILAHEFIHPSNACGKDNTTSAIEHSLASASGLCVHASDRNIEPMVSVIGVNTPRIATPGNLGCINHSVQMMITKGSAASCSQLGVDPLQCQISLDIYAGLGGARRISTDTSLIHAGAHNVLPSMNTKAGLGVQQLAVDTMLEECCRKVNDSEAGALGSLVTKGGDILCGSDQSPSTPPTSSSSKKTGISFLDKQAFLKQQLKLRDDARRRRELQPASAVSGDSSAALQSSECVATVVDQSMRRAAVSALQELGFLRKEGSHFCNKTTTQSTAAMTASSPSSDLLPIQRFLASSSSNLFGDRQLCPQVVTVPPSGADSNNSTRSLPAEFPECLFQRPPSSPSKSPSSTYSSLARSPLRPRRTLTVEAPPVYFGHRPLSPNTNEQCLLPDSAFKQEYVPAAQQEKRPEERPRYEGRPRHASTLSISSTASSLTLTSNSRPQSSYLKDSLQDTESSDLELQIMEMQQSCNNSSGGVSKLRSPEPSKDISLLTTRLANLQVMDHYCPVDEGTSAQTPSKVEAKDTQNGCPSWMGAGWALQIQQLVQHLADEAYSELRSEAGPPFHDQLLRDWLRRLGQVSVAVWEAHPGLRREVDKIRWQQGEPPQRHATCT